MSRSSLADANETRELAHLCRLLLFPWDHFRRSKGAIYLHTLLDVRGIIPSFIHMTDGKLHDVNVLYVLLGEPGSLFHSRTKPRTKW